MGASESKPTRRKVNRVTDNRITWAYCKEDPLDVYEEISRDISVEIQWRTGSAEEYEQTWRDAVKKGLYQHSNVLKIYDVKTEESEGSCSGLYLISFYVEYQQNTLGLELIRRREKKALFQENEIWDILFSIVAACAHLNKFGTFHGDLHPGKVFLTSDGGIKIADNGYISKGSSNYHRASNNDKNYCLLAPSQLADLKRREGKPTGNPLKTDVYSLGMTILQAATLINGDIEANCYDWANLVIDDRAVGERLATANRSYSLVLIDILKSMLVADDNVRPSFADLYAKMSPFLMKADHNGDSRPTNYQPPGTMLYESPNSNRRKQRQHDFPSPPGLSEYE